MVSFCLCAVLLGQGCSSRKHVDGVYMHGQSAGVCKETAPETPPTAAQRLPVLTHNRPPLHRPPFSYISCGLVLLALLATAQSDHCSALRDKLLCPSAAGNTPESQIMYDINNNYVLLNNYILVENL